jgi:hypothetical protein
MPVRMTDLFNEDGKPRRLIEIEREQLKFLVKRCNGNVAQIAKIMGVTRKQAYRRLFKTGLYTPEKHRVHDKETGQWKAPVLSAKQVGKVNKVTPKVKEYHWT